MFRCTESNAEVILQSRFTGRKLKLTGREKQVILDTWANVPNQLDVCRRVFVQIFLKKPALKRLWGLETVADAQLCEEEIFCRHADSFYKFFDLAVRSVSLEADYLVSVARSVGIRHCHFKEVSFDAENWLLFKNSVLDCILPYGVGLSSHSRKTTWNLFLAFIITGLIDQSDTKLDAYCIEDRCANGT